MTIFNILLMGGAFISITTIIGIKAYDKGVEEGRNWVYEVLDDAADQVAQEICDKYDLW